MWIFPFKGEKPDFPLQSGKLWVSLCILAELQPAISCLEPRGAWEGDQRQGWAPLLLLAGADTWATLPKLLARHFLSCFHFWTQGSELRALGSNSTGTQELRLQWGLAGMGCGGLHSLRELLLSVLCVLGAIDNMSGGTRGTLIPPRFNVN